MAGIKNGYAFKEKKMKQKKGKKNLHPLTQNARIVDTDGKKGRNYDKNNA